MIPLFRPYVSDKSRALVQQTLTPKSDGSLYIGQGDLVERFEQRLEEVFRVKDPITTNSATSAIDLALHVIGVGAGDEVITTPITCTATNSPIVTRKAIPVWADVDSLTGLINPEDVAKKITKRTKAIIAVNWGGAMPRYDLLKTHGLPVIEDAAHGPYESTFERGDYIVWSFQAIKHLTCGDGGALVSPDPERARLLRWYGLDRRSNKDFRCEQNIQEVGYKYHMNDINAAIGLGNIDHLNDLVMQHKQNAAYFTSTLTQYTGYRLKHVPRYSNAHAFWLYTVIVENATTFNKHMTKTGIAVSPVHARNDKHVAFNFPNGDLPGVDYFDSHQLSIPVGWWLTRYERERVANAIIQYASY